MRMPRWLPLLLGFLAAVGPVSTDMYLPAFPAIEATYGGEPGSAQLTLATWFAGLAVGQISQGMLADRFGRRRPLLFGMLIYTIASAGCALAPSLGALATYRFLEGVGGSAGMVLSRAIVRDLSEGLAAARMMSRLMLIMGVAPIVAPTMGGLILTVGDWHLVFWICTAYGAIGTVCVALLLPETLPEESRVRLSLGGQAVRFGSILSERGFISNALMGSATLFGMFAYLGGSPPVFIDIYHLPPPVYGMLFGTCAAAYIGGSQFNPAMLVRFGPRRVVRVSVRVFLAVAVALLVITLMRPSAWYALAIPLFCIMGTQGFINPNATVGALTRHAAHAGTASALMGTMQFIFGAISGLAVGLLADGTARPMAALMVVGGLGAVLCDLARPRSSW
jgi:DHA1 family bicyclomycin/chloramphenicol resistance-like MFS transporter